MKVSIQKSTGFMIASWSFAADKDILDNALSQGILESDVEIKEVSGEEHAALIKARDDATMSYVDKRRGTYPDFKDYIDGIVKGDLKQQQAYIDACLAVKAKYPK